MNRQQRKLFEALGRVEEFLGQNREALGSVVSSATHQFFLASRARVVRRMQSQERALRSVRRGVASKHELRERLVREHLRPIAAAAQVLLTNAREVPAFTVPDVSRPFTAFVGAGHGMAEAAKAREAEFVAVGFAPDFVAQLLAATEALDRGIKESAQTSGLRVEATTGLGVDGKAARKVLKLLDALIRKAVRDKALLNRWTHLRRVASAAALPKELVESGERGGVGEQPSGAVSGGEREGKAAA